MRKNDHAQKSSFKRRLIIVVSLFGLVQGLISVRLFYWQFLNASKLVSQGKEEQKFSTTILSSRGLIQTSDGVLMAVNKILYTVYMYLPSISNKYIVISKVAKVTGVSESSINDALNNLKDAQYVAVIKGLSSDKADALSILKIPGIDLIKEEQRYYPNSSMLSHVIGFLGHDKYGNLKGLYGLEGYYNGDLSGQNGQINGEASFDGSPILNNNLNLVSAQQGRDITLTIDSGIQSMVEDQLKKSVEDTKSKMGIVIVMDPHTGAIVAMSSYPNYDPNKYWEGSIIDCQLLQNYNDPKCNGTNPSSTGNSTVQSTPVPTTPVASPTSTQVQICKASSLDASSQQCSTINLSDLWTSDASNNIAIFDNPAISFLYEPGSVMKIVTAASGLANNKITPDTIIDESQTYLEVNGAKIYNWNKKPVGKVNMGQILEYSSNIGSSMVADLVGTKGLYDMLKDFGFGSLTNIDLSFEESGNIPDLSTWLAINRDTASFGQFFGVTPIQLTSMVSTIANGGVRMKPYIVKKLSDSSGTINVKPQVVKHVVSQQVASEVTDMMITADKFDPVWGLRNIKQYIPIIASKTGSAQIPLKDSQGFDPNNINATYVGFAPAKNPKFVLYVMLEYPQTGLFASTTAVPLWASIAQNLFIDYNISPAQ